MLIETFDDDTLAQTAEGCDRITAILEGSKQLPALLRTMEASSLVERIADPYTNCPNQLWALLPVLQPNDINALCLTQQACHGTLLQAFLQWDTEGNSLLQAWIATKPDEEVSAYLQIFENFAKIDPDFHYVYQQLLLHPNQQGQTPQALIAEKGWTITVPSRVSRPIRQDALTLRNDMHEILEAYPDSAECCAQLTALSMEISLEHYIAYTHARDFFGDTCWHLAQRRHDAAIQRALVYPIAIARGISGDHTAQLDHLFIEMCRVTNAKTLNSAVFESKIHDAVRSDDLSKIRQIFSEDTSPTIVQYNPVGETALHIAVRLQLSQYFSTVLSRASDFAVCLRTGDLTHCRTPLHNAIIFKNIHHIHEFSNYYLDPTYWTIPDDDNNTPFYYAIFSTLDILEIIPVCDQIHTLFIKPCQQYPTLTHAILSNSISVDRLKNIITRWPHAFENGAIIQDSKNRNALHYMAIHQHLSLPLDTLQEIFSTFSVKGLQTLFSQKDIDLHTPLYYAFKYPSEALITWMLHNGAPLPIAYLRLQLPNEKNVFHCLCQETSIPHTVDIDFLRSMIPSIGSSSSNTRINRDIWQCLLKADDAGNTPLHYALRSTHVRPLFINWMIQHGARIDAQNHRGETPTDLAYHYHAFDDLDQALFEINNHIHHRIRWFLTHIVLFLCRIALFSMRYVIRMIHAVFTHSMIFFQNTFHAAVDNTHTQIAENIEKMYAHSPNKGVTEPMNDDMMTVSFTASNAESESSNEVADETIERPRSLYTTT